MKNYTYQQNKEILLEAMRNAAQPLFDISSCTNETDLLFNFCKHYFAIKSPLLLPIIDMILGMCLINRVLEMTKLHEPKSLAEKTQIDWSRNKNCNRTIEIRDGVTLKQTSTLPEGYEGNLADWLTQSGVINPYLRQAIIQYANQHSWNTMQAVAKGCFFFIDHKLHGIDLPRDNPLRESYKIIIDLKKPTEIIYSTQMPFNKFSKGMVAEESHIELHPPLLLKTQFKLNITSTTAEDGAPVIHDCLQTFDNEAALQLLCPTSIIQALAFFTPRQETLIRQLMDSNPSPAPQQRPGSAHSFFWNALSPSKLATILPTPNMRMMSQHASEAWVALTRRFSPSEFSAINQPSPSRQQSSPIPMRPLSPVQAGDTPFATPTASPLASPARKPSGITLSGNPRSPFRKIDKNL